jgi:hypothetical protein
MRSGETMSQQRTQGLCFGDRNKPLRFYLLKAIQEVFVAQSRVNQNGHRTCPQKGEHQRDEFDSRRDKQYDPHARLDAQFGEATGKRRGLAIQRSKGHRSILVSGTLSCGHPVPSRSIVRGHNGYLIGQLSCNPGESVGYV